MKKERKKRSILWHIPADELRTTFNNAESLSEVLIYYGLRAAGGNHKTLERVLTHHGISFQEKKKYARQLGINKLHSSNRILTEDILTDNSPYGRGVVRRRLIKEELIPYVCSVCNMHPTWMGEPLTLILDHINGVYNDHRLVNLRFVCGNCNSQLNTHCRKNKKRQSEFES